MRFVEKLRMGSGNREGEWRNRLRPRGVLSKRFVSLTTALLMAFGAAAPSHAAGGGSGSGSQGGTYFTGTDNWGGGAANSNKDNDLDYYTRLAADQTSGDFRKAGDPQSGTAIKNGTPNLYPFEFKIDVPAGKTPQTSAYLLIRGYDVDEEDGEWDRVYLSKTPLALLAGPGVPSGYTWPTTGNWNDATYRKGFDLQYYVGALSGNNAKWNTTVFKLDPAQVAEGDNFVGISVHHNPQIGTLNTGWETVIDWGQLVIDGGSRKTGELTDVNIAVIDGKITLTTSVAGKELVPGQDFIIEANVIDKEGNNLVTETRKVPQSSLGSTIQIPLSDNDIDKTQNYTVNVILFDEEVETTGPNANRGYKVPTQAEHIFSVSTFDPKAADIAKTGLQYEPTVFAADDFKNKYYKLNGAAHGANLQKVKIGTLPDPAKGKLVLVDGSGQAADIVLGRELTVAELPSLRFIPVSSGFSGTASFQWNGFDGEKYALTDALVTLAANAAPVVGDIEKSAVKGQTVDFTKNNFASTFADADEETLNAVQIVTLPDPAKGRLVLVNGAVVTDVAAGQVIPEAALGQLKFMPKDGQTGVSSFTWTGSDGKQNAKDAKKVTIRINTPPVVGNIAKTGLAGATIGFAADDFAQQPAYQDAEQDALNNVKISLPADFGTKGKLWYTPSVGAAVYLTPGQSASIPAAVLGTLAFGPDAELPDGSTVTFQWEGYDGTQYSEAPALVTIAYSGKPVAQPQTISAEEGTTSIAIVLKGTDAETVTGLVYGIKSVPAKGTLQPADQSQPNGNGWIYVPNPGFTGGEDSFTFTVTDGDGQESDPVTVKVLINKALDGWVGDKAQGDPAIVKALTGQPLKLSAVSSLLANEVVATVNGHAVSLVLANAETFAADGYKKWVRTDYVLPQDTAASEYAVSFEARKADQSLLPAEAPDKRIDNKFAVIGANLKLTANPAKIVGDGKTTTTLTAVLKDADGQPISGVKVVFAAPTGVGTFVGQDWAITNEQGLATAIYKSAKITGVNEQQIPVTATVLDEEKGLSAKDQIAVIFQPATIQGVITKGVGNAPVSGATVRVTLDLNGDGQIESGVDFDETIVTDENGAYSVPVPRGDEKYDLEITQTVEVGGVQTPVTYRQKANVGVVTGGGDESFDSEKTVTGIVLFKEPNGQTGLLSSEIVSKTKVYLKDAAGNYIMENGKPKPFPLQAQGVFHADGLAVGDYTLEIRYEIEAGKEITIARGTAGVKANGELNITQELVDPYGTIRDASTKAVIKDAKVTLYYADTQRNKDNGRTPGTGVVLPPLVGFDPNGNASPEQLSDANGFYAYMVYPETDYYLVVSKDGYQLYRSATLPVEWDIVKHDLVLNPVSAPESSADPAPVVQPNVSLSLSVDKSMVEEGGQSVITVDYKNQSSSPLVSGVVKLAIPAGATVIDANGGKADGNTVTWTVNNLAAGQAGSFKVTVKWPQLEEKEASFDAKGEFAAGGSVSPVTAQSATKVVVFSKRFDNLKHQRYILGYPDGEFKPNRSLTRAELAAIVARLTDNSESKDPLNFKDVQAGHWAANYIKIATKHGYFNGFEDGTFRPEAPVTRGELAAVMARFLKLDTGSSSTAHFSDVVGHWSAAAVEALYRGKFLSGYPDGTFKPQNDIIRSEAVTLINRMLYRGPLQGLEPLFPDMPASHWAFGDVQEATVSHESVRQTDGSETWKSKLEDDVK
ncbi:S-layer homology domain-containing protein [Paenibacillus sp. MBLB4367]|uniref:S-layer homology domain-containing protein n=1 Tax=Paenibacillus sp. MBLB4367 TaxID=3384767 RepID=UPI00390806A7